MFCHLGKINKLVGAYVLETMAVTLRTVVYLTGVEYFLRVIVAELNVALDDENHLTVVGMAVVTAGCARFKTAEHNLIILILEVTCVEQTLAALETFDVL